MSAFIGNGRVTVEPILNDGFWPDIDAENLRAALRIGDVSAARLEVCIVAALISVNRELARLKAQYQAQGFTNLAAVPAPQVAGQSSLTHTYTRAIYCTCAAELAERYSTYSATGTGAAKAEAEDQSADDYRRDARFAIRDLLGVSRTTVELL